MDRSKLTVFAIVALIALGVGAWSWVNIFVKPDWNPDKAAVYADHFFVRCSADHTDEFCNDIIGADHRRCFGDQLQRVPEHRRDEHGEYRHDRRAYLECMDEAVEHSLHDSN